MPPTEEPPVELLIPGDGSSALPPPAGWRHGVWGKIAHIIGLDSAIAYTVLARGWSGISGLITVALIARRLSPAEQGYYYTFGSLVALQIVFALQRPHLRPGRRTLPAGLRPAQGP